MRSIGRNILILTAILAMGVSLRGVMAQTLVPTAYFAHVPVGGGFTTTFTLLNTGSGPLTGNLILTLTKPDHTPINVMVTDLSLNKSSAGSGSPITVPIADPGIASGGTMFLAVTPTNPNDSLAVGWARVESSGGTLGGVATFALTSGTTLQAIAGVLSAELTSVATIPVDDDVDQRRYTGYAVANPGNNPISIKVVEVPADGGTAQNPIVTLSSINLDPGKQSAAFFFQDPRAGQKFRGSAVLIGQAGATFSVVALVQVQGATGPLYTAIPVIPAKAPSIN